MKLSYHPGHRARRPIWFAFLFLTIIFFFNAHDITNATLAVGSHNRSIDYVLANSSRGSLSHQISLVLLALFAVVSLTRDRIKAPFWVYGPLGWILLAYVAWAFLSPFWADDLLLTLGGYSPLEYCALVVSPLRAGCHSASLSYGYVLLPAFSCS